MPTLSIVVNHPKGVPTSTQMLQFEKGVEQFYYAQLFSGSQPYAGKAEAWRSWLKAGFHIGSKGYPPAAAEPDRLTVNMNPIGKVLEVTVSSPNKAAVLKLQELLQTIEALRPFLAGKDGAARAEALGKNDKVSQQFVLPMMNALKKAGLAPDEITSFVAMTQRGLAALTDEEIASVQISVK